MSKVTDPWEKEQYTAKWGEKTFGLNMGKVYWEGGPFQAQEDLVASNKRDNIQNDSTGKLTISFSNFSFKPFLAVFQTLAAFRRYIS